MINGEFYTETFLAFLFLQFDIRLLDSREPSFKTKWGPRTGFGFSKRTALYTCLLYSNESSQLYILIYIYVCIYTIDNLTLNDQVAVTKSRDVRRISS